MTRKQALKKAIELLADNEDLCEKLKEIHDDLPLVHWTDKSLRDVVEQYIADFGKIPTATDFKKKDLPSHTVIEQKYNMSLRQWLNANYPSPSSIIDRKELYTTAFISEYLRITPTSQEDYNSRRSKENCTWQTVARYCGLSSWNSLVAVLKLEKYKKEKNRLNISVSIHTNLKR